MFQNRLSHSIIPDSRSIGRLHNERLGDLPGALVRNLDDGTICNVGVGKDVGLQLRGSNLVSLRLVSLLSPERREIVDVP